MQCLAGGKLGRAQARSPDGPRCSPCAVRPSTLLTIAFSRAALSCPVQEGIPKLAQVMLSTARGAKAEKLVEKASQLAKILVLYSIDAPDDQQVWIKVRAVPQTASQPSGHAGRHPGAGLQRAVCLCPWRARRPCASS